MQASEMMARVDAIVEEHGNQQSSIISILQGIQKNTGISQRRP